MCRNIRPFFNYDPPATEDEEGACTCPTALRLGCDMQVTIPGR